LLYQLLLLLLLLENMKPPLTIQRLNPLTSFLAGSSGAAELSRPADGKFSTTL
jgi:hypothetical protein